MLTIRFSRVGKKNRAYYRVVLTENTAPVKGRFTELLGSYDPHSKKAVLKAERILYWKEKGATCSVSAHNLLVREGILKEAKKAVRMERKQPEKTEETKESVETNKDNSAVVPETEVKEKEKPAEEFSALVEDKKE